MKQTRRLLALLCLFLSTSLYSQSLYKVDLGEKLANSTLVFEGRVISARSFWNEAHTLIFTSNLVEPFKVFKGTTDAAAVEVITQGGEVEGQVITVSELLNLQVGSMGVFFCYPNRIGLHSAKPGRLVYDVYSSAQGFIGYDPANQRAAAPFTSFENINTGLYPLLVSATGRSYINLRPDFDVRSLETTTVAKGEAPVITSFSPATVVAGKFSDPASNVLTITGSGFGVPGGATAKLTFDDANNGPGGTPWQVLSTSDLILSWTDTEIRVKVPGRAGSGTFQVVDAGGVSVNSPADLEVSIAILTADFGAAPTSRMYTLMNTNGTGGYSYYYSTSTLNSGVDFSTAPQEAPFARAITTWRQMAGLNFTYGGTSTLQNVDLYDNINLIMLDNTGTGYPALSAGVLAVCYSGGFSCNGSDYVFRSGFEVIIRNPGVSTGSANFNNGPCKTSTSIVEIDMESVILHELGHALNLGHIIDGYKGSWPNIDAQKVMNYSIVNGSDRRSPDWAALTGAQFNINPHGFSYPCTSQTEMIPLTPITIEAKDECPLSFPATATPEGTSISFDLDHTSSNRFRDPQYTAVNTSGTGTSITNNAWYVIRTKTSGAVSLNVTGYSTVPGTQAGCTGAGIELSLYQVASCPTGQAFPAPVAYRTFNANGAITPITGLLANTNYLLMADGISNTRAVFSLGLLGTALPLSFIRFDGRKNDGSVLLGWTTGYEKNNDRFEVETSKDGNNFYSIGTVASSGDHEEETSYSFTDPAPASGNNYYRIRQVDLDGKTSYSKTIVVEFTGNVQVKLYPNPVTSNLQLLFSKPAASVSVSLFGMNGVLLRTTSASAVARQYTIDMSAFAPGVYIIEIRTDGAVQRNRFIRR